MEDLVSIIVPCYKNFDNIEDTLKSIFDQDYDNIEIIISDDGSYNFDDEKEKISEVLLEKNANIANIIVNRLSRNMGTVRNCNSALRLASGKYVKILPPGDEFYSRSVLSQCVDSLKNKSDTLLIGRTFYKNARDENTGEYRDSVLYRYQARHYRKSIIAPTINDIRTMAKMSDKKRNDLLKSRCVISTVSVFFPMSILRKTNGFLDEYRLLEDMPYWPYLAEKGVHFEFSELIMVLYSVGGISNNGARNKEFYKEYKKVMNEIYIENDSRFGIVKKYHKILRRKEVCWPEIKLNDRKIVTRLKYIDVWLLGLYRHTKYLLFNTKL